MKKIFVLVVSCFFLSAITLAQVINMVIPDSAYQGQQNLQVSITGTNLNFSQTSSVLLWLKQANDSIPAYAPNWTAPNSARGFFNFPLAATIGFYDVYCKNTVNATIATLTNGFKILPALPAPDAPVLINPANNQILTSNMPSFNWNNLQYASQFEIIIDDNPSFDSPLAHQSNLSQNTYLNQNLVLFNGVYYWKVRAKNLSGITSNWSTVFSFTVNAETQLTSINPDYGYTGQNNLSVAISGVNTYFANASSTIDFQFTQNNYSITPTSQYATNPYNAVTSLNIPAQAPVGFYNVNYQIPGAQSTLYNSFYVHPGNSYSGAVYIDANNNNIFDIGEIACPQGIIHVSPNTNFNLTNSQGYFQGYAFTGNHTISFINPSQYFTVSPSQHLANFLGTGQVDSDNNFAMHPVGDINDLQISATNNSPPRPGFNYTIDISVANVGTTNQTGYVSLSFNPLINFNSSNNPSYTLSGNTITWDFQTIQPFNQTIIKAQFYIPASMVIGDLLPFSALASGTGQEQTPQNNAFNTVETIVNSYDPNIKEVIPHLGLTPEQVQNSEPIEYIIHFQNTGTADAINIRILDTISTFLNLETFHVISSSHQCITRLLDNRLVEFRFNNINLPDSNSNEPLSHGYVKYKILPNSSFTIGDEILNTAYIYFDFNPPIITNTTNTHILTNVSLIDLNPTSIQVFPNPFNSSTVIKYQLIDSGPVNIKLFNAAGQLVSTLFFGENKTGVNQFTINRNNLSTGVYFISLSSKNQHIIEKVVLIN